MITLRPSKERGHADHGWLNAKHTFSFADYYDPRHMGFRSLRVMNEDRIAGGMGFGMHPHADMEIVTLLLEGALRHKDSMGNEGVIGPGEIQYMSAGSGVKHSEFNDSKTAPAHLYQIWMLPTHKGLPPAYGQRDFSKIPTGKIVPLASPTGEDGAMAIRSDSTIYTAKFTGGEAVSRAIAPGRYAWVQAVSGNLVLNGVHKLAAGDGAAIAQESEITLTGDAGAQALVFDLA